MLKKKKLINKKSSCYYIVGRFFFFTPVSIYLCTQEKLCTKFGHTRLQRSVQGPKTLVYQDLEALTGNLGFKVTISPQ